MEQYKSFKVQNPSHILPNKEFIKYQQWIKKEKIVPSMDFIQFIKYQTIYNKQQNQLKIEITDDIKASNSDNNRAHSVSPRMSQTEEQLDYIAVAVEAQIDQQTQNEIETQIKPKPKPLENEIKSISEPLKPPKMLNNEIKQEPEIVTVALSKPSPNKKKLGARVHSKSSTFSTMLKSYDRQNAFDGNRVSENKTNSVLAKINNFNKQNEDIRRRKSTNPWKFENNETKSKKKRVRRKKRKKAPVQNPKLGTVTSDKMSHIKLTRWFNLDNKQTAKLNNPSFCSSLEKQVAKWGILKTSIHEKYVKVQISRRIPLPQRQSQWNNILEILQNKFGGQSLVHSETVIDD